ncbi:class A beta-lactamase [Macrococcoides canis]|uniref:Beta-lactamase BlaZ-like protein n=1 Tax=Macrococcoides canis TaxID=1855823 RepID=A0A0D6DR74_9STAP|nr:class A beta-lactamase [Macrococcus canis]ARQ05750.1 beta-lactamase BlaZ-like protein [Macrococcus canis]WBF52866.1 class A beta-lactamase [Macrococcus canis]CDO67672.1 beta-lactamase homolog BlaZm [Macrococcus canis]
MQKFLMLIIALIFLSGCNSNNINSSKINEDIKVIENKYNIQAGVYVNDLTDKQKLSYNEERLFPYASTFKVINSALLIEKLGMNNLDKEVKVSERDIVLYSPIIEKYKNKNVSLKMLIEAALLYSDNTANNLIIEELGGLKEVEKRLSALGINGANVNRKEVALNFYDPKKNEDTISAKNMSKVLTKMLTGDVLEYKEQIFLIDLMKKNKTGTTLIKKGMDKKFIVGDKSGQGANYGVRNDIAVVYKKQSNKPIIVVVFTKAKNEKQKPSDTPIVEISKVINKNIK